MDELDASYLVAVILYGNYIFDLLVYLVHWTELKPSFKSYYIVHHGVCLVALLIWRCAGGSSTLQLAYTVGFILWISELPLAYLIQLIRFSYPQVWCTPLQIGLACLAQVCSLMSYIYVALHIPKSEWFGVTPILLLLIGLTMDAIDASGTLFFLMKRIKGGRKAKPTIETRRTPTHSQAASPQTPKIKSP
ncbi:hypothetical protein SmJEL517_g01343 [Synchytrium microbalum]|uniref:TLC domain-containing protein n=1 Tax=Synchytrium microbalum TaxID=1806994 RepID=A0A507CAK5_9FUNG|nr:uncharacterized protein SmJEL517_g01343 [Synchytrium microbalum]TPX36652.1 hypothetical protein SmJEL517_g01343 [Synchytrium microbalum]